jgi:hypothetical protein
MSTLLTKFGLAIYRLIVCCMVGFAAALIAAMIAAILAMMLYGGIEKALDLKSHEVPVGMFAYVDAALAALVAGATCGLACLRVPHVAFRGVLLRVVVPGCLLSALCGAIGGATVGAVVSLLGPNNVSDEFFTQALFGAALASGLFGPVIAWSVNRALRGHNGRRERKMR